MFIEAVIGFVCVAIIAVSSAYVLRMANRSAFSVSLFAQGRGGLLFVRIGGSGVRGFFLDVISLQMDWSSRLSEVMYAVKVALFK